MLSRSKFAINKMVFCVVETINKKELFVCPVNWFTGDDLKGVVHYPTTPKEFLKFQGLKHKLPNETWSSELARLLAKYTEYQLAVQGMERLEDGNTSEENRWNSKEHRKLNSLRNFSTVPSVQNTIDNQNALFNSQLNQIGSFDHVKDHPVTVNTICPKKPQGTQPISLSVERDHFNDSSYVLEDAESSNALESDPPENNVIIDLPDVISKVNIIYLFRKLSNFIISPSDRLHKVEYNISSIYSILSQMDEKINKLLEGVANIGSVRSENISSHLISHVEQTTSNLATLLPIKNENGFNEFETMLRDKACYKKFVAEMTSYGGTSGDKKGYKIAYGLIDQLFTREFMTNCSWTGSSKGAMAKVNFSAASTFLNAFFEIVNLADSRYTKSEAKDFFKEKILRNAKARYLNLHRKESLETSQNHPGTDKDS